MSIGRRFPKNWITIIFVIFILIISSIITNLMSFIPAIENNNENAYNVEYLSSSDQSLKLQSSSRSAARAFKDVGIESVSDIDAANFIDHFPGKVVHMNLSLRNYGDVDIIKPFDLLMTVSDGSSRYPSYFYQENLTLPSGINANKIKANTTFPYNISWNWTPPLSMPSGAEFNFSVSDITFQVCFTTLLEGDQNSVNNQLCLDVKVEKPDFDINLEPGWTINNLYFPQEPFHVVPKKGQTNQFELNFTLYNLGEATYINFTVQAPTDWKAIPPARQFWQARSNSSAPPQNLSITVFPSIKLQYLPTATPLAIKLTAIAESFPIERDTLIFKGDVSFVPTPNIISPKIPEGQEVYFVPPGEAYIDFRVQNLGNGEDNFDTWAQVGERNVDKERLERDGWRAVVHSGKRTRILARGEWQTVTVKVVVPQKVRWKSPCGITLFAASVKDPIHLDGLKNRTFYIFADLYRDVSFNLKGDALKTISMYPSGEISRILEIRNTGNTQDNTLRVNVSRKPEDWNVIIDSSNIPQQGLQRNGTAEIMVIIKTPKYVVESMYDIKIAALSENQIRDEITLNVQILKVRQISLKCKDFKKSGNVSEKISFLVTVENNGNTKDSIDLKHTFITPRMKDMGWKIVMSKNYTTLYPYESRDVIISVFIPLGGLADTDFLTPTLNGYIIQIRGISQNDTSVIANKEIEVIVNPIYDFSFSKKEDKRYMILHNTQNVYYTFSISNNGNDIDRYFIDLDADPGNKEWVSIPFVERKLRPGVTEKIFIELFPPPHLPAGIYEFTIKATSEKKPTLIQTLNLTIEIIEFDLALTEIRIGEDSLGKANIKEGETVLLRAKLENIGELDYYNKTIEQLVGKERVELIIRFTEGSNYIGETNVTYLPTKKTGSNNSIWVGIPWKIGKARDYEIAVEIPETSDIPESKTSNNKIKGTLTVRARGAGEDEDSMASAEDLSILLILIIIFILIMLAGIWLTISISKRKAKRGYTVDGEYKPYEVSDKAVFDKDEEEEEPEGGVLAIHDAHPYGGKKKDKFLTDLSTILTMKPIKKTRPIRKSKPLTAFVGEGRPAGLERPKIAGYLPPKQAIDSEPAEKEMGNNL